MDSMRWRLRSPGLTNTICSISGCKVNAKSIFATKSPDCETPMKSECPSASLLPRLPTSEKTTGTPSAIVCRLLRRNSSPLRSEAMTTSNFTFSYLLRYRSGNWLAKDALFSLLASRYSTHISIFSGAACMTVSTPSMMESVHPYPR